MDLSYLQADEQTVGGLIFSLLLSLVVFWIAQKKHFFQLPSEEAFAQEERSPIGFLHLVGAVACFLVLAYVILPISFILILYVKTGELSHVKIIAKSLGGWLQVAALFLFSCVLIGYCFLFRRQIRRYIFWGLGTVSASRFIKTVGMGCVAWVVSYPFVLLVGIITGWIAQKMWGISHVEQEAVLRLKETMSNKMLFLFMIVTVAFIVPFIEELFFRGFLHNCFKRYLGRGWAIALTAPIFAVVHYTSSQGYGNFQLIVSLLVLSFFLSFIYERERTLWAPITLHVTFNLLNILLIILSAR